MQLTKHGDIHSLSAVAVLTAQGKSSVLAASKHSVIAAAVHGVSLLSRL
jgi:hypothetical protein